MTNNTNEPMDKSMNELDEILQEMAKTYIWEDGEITYTPIDNAKSRLEAYVNKKVWQARDSEQNRLFSVLRHLHIKHDAKAIMRVRKEWDDFAQEEAKRLAQLEEKE